MRLAPLMLLLPAPRLLRLQGGVLCRALLLQGCIAQNPHPTHPAIPLTLLSAGAAALPGRSAGQRQQAQARRDGGCVSAPPHVWRLPALAVVRRCSPPRRLLPPCTDTPHNT